MPKRRANGEGNIRKRKDGRWEGRYTVGHDPETGKAIIKNVLGKTQTEVKEKLKKAIEENVGIDYGRAKTYTVGSWLEVWMENYAKIKLRPSTYKTSQGFLKNHIKPQIGSIPLADCTSLDLQRFYKHLLDGGRVDRIEAKKKPKGLAPKTVRNIHQMIGSAYNLAIEQKLVSKNPTQGCALPKVEHKEMKTLTADQLSAFFQEARDSGVYELYYLDLATGLRRGELLGLKWTDVDLDRGVLKIQRAISRQNGQAHIDPDKCIRCGRCLKECKFNAIVRLERPCRKACGMDCIHSDGLGRADIDYSKCTSCGQCMVSCPFGAISDKSQIFQTIQAVKSDTPVYVALAPAFVGQFGPEGVPERMRKAFQRLGFADVYEVAIGADLCVIEEAADFLEEVPEKHKFMVTSCCPSWSDMVKKLFPQFEKNISVAFTPMVLTARMIKRDHPDCKVVFVGPCDSKKLEARRESVRSDVDFVLTFEEALGIFAAKGMDKAFPPEDEEEMPAYSSRDARRFAYSGGVAQAVVNAIHDMEPDREVKVAAATGLADCRKLLMMAKVGKYDGYLLEGMACPGGCIAGAGTLRPIEQSHKEVEAFSSEAKFTCANDTPYMDYLPLIEEKDKIRKL